MPPQQLFAQIAQSTALLEEIVVTARRRAEGILEVPFTIQALSGQQLLGSGIGDLSSLKFTTPGFFPDTNNGFVQVYLRGIGNAIFVGADPSVATFVDDVPQIYAVTTDALLDVERVEILKGAQGGLYGRNATGGVINIITRRPSTDSAASKIRLSWGEKDTLNASSWFNLPLGDRAAASLALDRQVHDAYIDNRAKRDPYQANHFPNGSFLGSPEETATFFNKSQNPSHIYDRDLSAARGKLLFEPTDRLSLVLFGHWVEKDDSASGQFMSTTPAFNQGALEGLFSSLGIETNLPPGFIPDLTREEWAVAIGPAVLSYIEDSAAGSTLTWNRDDITFTWIAAHRELNTHTTGDSATSAVPFVPLDIRYGREYTYQELRTQWEEESWRLLSGVTWLDNQLRGRTDVFFLSHSLPIGTTKVKQEIENWSIYAELERTLAGRFKVSLSGRYMEEKNNAVFLLPVDSSSQTQESMFTPAITLSAEWPESLVYLRWARGFKTGGINLITAPAFYPRPSDGSQFDSERVDTFELGYKGTLPSQALQIQAALFYNDYRDLQVDVRARPGFPAITTAIINADSARTFGAEWSFSWAVNPHLTIAMDGGWLEAEYRDFALSGSQVLADFDLSGERMPKAPEWQWAWRAEWDLPLPSESLHMVGNLLASYVDDVVFKYSALPGLLPDARGDSYWLVNLRLGVRTADDRWGLYLVADNLLDKVYFIGADAGTFGNLLNYGTPRVVRLEATFDY
ncbi:MAG: hypothetical protein KatS3mg124_0652 [Porticoccaceae bacterium]|nr:MAG: hypothetical protein KatS3mg124_0652 [Porticoccaceae bacterium]